LTLVPSNDPSRIYGPEIDVHVLYGDGNWPDCWLKHWTNLELFPVISPTLLNNQPLRTVRDLRNHVILHADDGREWHAWLSAVDALDLLRTRHHFMSDARIAIEAATYGYGVALGDSMTVVDMLAKGNLIVPFDRSVAAVHSFYIVCRNEVRSTPIVKVFIDWIYAALAESDAKAEPQVSGRSSLRRRAERRIAAPALKSTPGYAAQGPAIGKRPSTQQPPRTRQKRKPGDRAR
jgi:LysR family glycine cleavage system transcriptional activator